MRKPNPIIVYYTIVNSYPIHSSIRRNLWSRLSCLRKTPRHSLEVDHHIVLREISCPVHIYCSLTMTTIAPNGRQWKLERTKIIGIDSYSISSGKAKWLNVLLKWMSEKSGSYLTTQHQKYRVCLYKKTFIPFALVIYELVANSALHAPLWLWAHIRRERMV